LGGSEAEGIKKGESFGPAYVHQFSVALCELAAHGRALFLLLGIGALKFGQFAFQFV
jgi:hypothetical protein